MECRDLGPRQARWCVATPALTTPTKALEQDLFSAESNKSQFLFDLSHESQRGDRSAVACVSKNGKRPIAACLKCLLKQPTVSVTIAAAELRGFESDHGALSGGRRAGTFESNRCMVGGVKADQQKMRCCSAGRPPVICV